MNVKLQNQFLSSQFSGTWTPSFFELTGKLSKIQENNHPPKSGHFVITYAATVV